jgi:SEC-C motif-containing protein
MLRLEVLAHSLGPAPDAAVVRFVARYRVAGNATRLAETSRFVRETAQGVDRWFYVDGDQA